MNIAVVGAGAAGSIIAGFLSKTNEEVLLVGRPEQVSVINKNGLLVHSCHGEERITVRVAEKLDKEYDLVIFATRLSDLEFAYQENHSYLENCFIMSIQSGVQGANILSCHFDPHQIISSLVLFGARYLHPGEVCWEYDGQWIIGRPYLANDENIYAIADLLENAFTVEVSSHIIAMQWLQLICDFHCGISALMGQATNETFGDLDFCKLHIMLVREGLEIVQSAGIDLKPLPRASLEQIQHLSAMPLAQAATEIQKRFMSEPSLQGNGIVLESIKRQRASEVDFLNGEITHVADSLRLTAPLNYKIVELVHQVEQTQRYFTPREIKKLFNLIS